MVKLEYVKKRKRKKAAAIVAALTSMGIAVFILVSFLGRYVGQFTVALDTGDVKLSLCEKSEFNDPTTYLKLDSLPAFDLYSFTYLPSADDIDRESEQYAYEVNYDSDGNASMKYFKYTFFVRNSGNIAADYVLRINLTKNDPSADGRYADTFLRVMVYENDAYSTDHSYTVYAKKSEIANPTYEGDDSTTFKEYISYGSPEKAHKHGDEFPGFAEMFESDHVIASLPVNNFQRDDVMRYTLIFWLEGEDPQAKENAPEGAQLKLGVTINAYENK